QIPRVGADGAGAGDPGDLPSGFGDGDVAAVDVDDDAAFDALVAGLELDDAPVEAVDVAAVIAERDQFKEAAMRVQAAYENFRKRSTAQAAGAVDRATGSLADAFLPVLDAAEAAYLQHPDEVGPLLNVLLAELKKHGLETLDLESQPFDPEVAEAVAHESADGGEVVVAEVLRSGYRWKGRTLRPAMVRTKD
ncbi:MAG: nucleotide exchange factor GrpE, partial [Ilumatobacteraceae bacterium]